MEEVQNEQISTLENENKTEVTEKENDEISFGKFKDANALLNAYNSLQAEFTKRCQRIKELEGKTEKITEAFSEIDGGSSKPNAQGITDKDKEEILKDYLKGIIGSEKKLVFLDNDGVAAKTNTEKPKSIDEAGKLAKSMFKN